MRILIDYRPALRERSGVGEYVYRLVEALDTLAGAEATDPQSSAALSLTLFSSSWKDRIQARQGAVVDRRIPVHLLNALWHRLGWPPVERLAGGSFDVAHSPHPLLMPSRGAAGIVTIHDLDFLRHPERTRAEVRRDYAALVRVHVRRADHVIVPSHYTADQVADALDLPRDRIAVCPHGAPPWRPREREPADGHLLFLGTLEPRKNVGRLLKAYAVLVERGRNVPALVLAGRSTPAAAAWLDEITRPPLTGRVQYLGYVTDAVRETLYQQARLLVVPSFDEGFGLTALEAMTVGVPVVASNRGALPEVLGDAGLLVDPESTEDLVTALERMSTDTDLAHQAVERGRARAARFTWRASALATVDAYRHAIARRQTRDTRHPERR